MKLSGMKVDSAAIEQGVWIDHPLINGVRVKVRGGGNADFKRLAAALGRKVTAAQRVEGLSPEQSDEITVRLLHETILQDWDGLTEEDGSKLAYTKDRALAILSDPDLRVFRDGVEQASTVVATRIKNADETAIKNLQSGSNGI